MRTSQLGGAGRPLPTSGVHTAQDRDEDNHLKGLVRGQNKILCPGRSQSDEQRPGAAGSRLSVDRAWRGGSGHFHSGSSSETAVRDPVPLQPSCRDPSGTFRPQPCTNPPLSPTDRISIRSYRTDISMSDFENSRDFEGRDNMGASPEAQETSLGGKDGTPLPEDCPGPGEQA